MLFLPKKPKIKIEHAGHNQYLVTFLGHIKNEQEFNDMLDIQLENALGVNDALKNPNWPSQRVTVSTDDIGALEKRLVYFEISTGITVNPGSK